eukprot:2661848-Amphidinium_carterae.2
MEEFQGNQEADVVANLGVAEHEPHEPFADWLHWELVAKVVRHVWLLVGLKLLERSEVWPRVRLPTVPTPSRTFRLSFQCRCCQSAPWLVLISA